MSHRYSYFLIEENKKTPKEFGNSWELREFLHHDVGDKKDYLLCRTWIRDTAASWTIGHTLTSLETRSGLCFGNWEHFHPASCCIIRLHGITFPTKPKGIYEKGDTENRGHQQIKNMETGGKPSGICVFVFEEAVRIR